MQNNIYLLYFLSFFLSFSLPTYATPWNNFQMEFCAFISAFLLIPNGLKKIRLNAISIAILSLILISTINHFVIGVYFHQNLIIFNLFISLFLIYYNSIIYSTDEIKIKILLVLIFVGLFTSFSILYQHFQIEIPVIGEFIHTIDINAARPYGNIRQPNLAATLIITALCSTIILHQLQIIRTGHVLLLSLIFGYALYPPLSKTSIATLFAIALFFLLNSKIKFFGFIVLASASFFAGVATHSKLNDFLSTSQLRKLSESSLSTGRIELWQTIIDANFKHPINGYGVFNTTAAHFESRELDVTPRNQVISGAHNIFLDFTTWFGIPIGAAIGIALIFIFLLIFKKNKKFPEKLSLLIPISIHANLENPLHSANFLFLLAFILAYLSEDLKYKEVNINRKKISIILLPILIGSFVIFHEYQKISYINNELKFQYRGFSNAHPPAEINIFVLDKTASDIELRLKKSSKNHDIEFIRNTAISMPSYNTYCILLRKLSESENKKEKEEIDLWTMKSKYLFDEKQFFSLKKNCIKP